MKSTLVSAALDIIPSPQMLVNVVRLRVRQLALGHRPLVLTLPSVGMADIALTEVIQGKISFESTASDETPETAEAKVVEFPLLPPTSKKRAA